MSLLGGRTDLSREHTRRRGQTQPALVYILDLVSDHSTMTIECVFQGYLP